MWLMIAAGAVAIASMVPRSRDLLKDIPLLPIAVAAGLDVLSDSLRNIDTLPVSCKRGTEEGDVYDDRIVAIVW